MEEEDRVLRSSRQRGSAVLRSDWEEETGRLRGEREENLLWAQIVATWLLNLLPYSEHCNSLLVPAPLGYLGVPPDLFQVLTLTPLQSLALLLFPDWILLVQG